MDRATNNKRWRPVFEIEMPYGDDLLHVYHAGNKKDGYVYSIVTLSESTFRDHELTDAERKGLIESLGGKL